MRIPQIKDLVTDNKKVKFLHFQDNKLWYVCEDGFEFPVPVSDTGSGIFLAEDRALVFMRWIRKHIEFVKDAMHEQAVHHAEASAFISPNR